MIWGAGTGHELHTSLKVHTNRVYYLQWTADGKTLVSGSYNGSIRTWIHPTTWQQTSILNEHNEGIYVLASSSNSRILASASFRSASPACMGTELRVVGKVLATGCEDSKAAAYM
jgi:WD40 repeat protein